MALMTIDEAREILGGEYSAKLTDEQLEHTIMTLEALAPEYIRTYTRERFHIIDEKDING